MGNGTRNDSMRHTHTLFLKDQFIIGNIQPRELSLGDISLVLHILLVGPIGAEICFRYTVGLQQTGSDRDPIVFLYNM